MDLIIYIIEPVANPAFLHKFDNFKAGSFFRKSTQPFDLILFIKKTTST
jgi:hypothetical protein